MFNGRFLVRNDLYLNIQHRGLRLPYLLAEEVSVAAGAGQVQLVAYHAI